MPPTFKLLAISDRSTLPLPMTDWLRGLGAAAALPLLPSPVAARLLEENLTERIAADLAELGETRLREKGAIGAAQ